MDSVTLSGAWRARYSRKASVKSRLRDLRVRRASVPLHQTQHQEWKSLFSYPGYNLTAVPSKSIVQLQMQGLTLLPTSKWGSGIRTRRSHAMTKNYDGALLPRSALMGSAEENRTEHICNCLAKAPQNLSTGYCKGPRSRKETLGKGSGCEEEVTTRFGSSSKSPMVQQTAIKRSTCGPRNEGNVPRLPRCFLKKSHLLGSKSRIISLLCHQSPKVKRSTRSFSEMSST